LLWEISLHDYQLSCRNDTTPSVTINFDAGPGVLAALPTRGQAIELPAAERKLPETHTP
jgi:hypothetical protein